MAEEIPPPWAALERADGTWEVIDNETSTLYTVDDRLGTQLWQHHRLWTLPLHQALDAARLSTGAAGPAAGGEDHAFLDIELAGVRVRYLDVDRGRLEALGTNLAVARPRYRGTAEVIVRLGPQAQVDLLHRSVPGVRVDVHHQIPGDSRWHSSAGALPSLPPLAAPPYRGRFCALHAALLVLPSGRSVILCGNQKAGKTTAALWARDAGLAAVATDEVVLLDTATGAAFGVPLATAVRSHDQRRTIPLPSDASTHLGATLPAGLVVLTPTTVLPAGVLQGADTQHQAVAWIAEHLRDAGSNHAATHRSLRALVSRIPVHRLGVSAWPALRNDLETALPSLLKSLERS